MRYGRTVTLLMAEDDPDDRLLVSEGVQECRLVNPLVFVQDGEELMDYLRGRNVYADIPPPSPDLILLDLNMPRKDGREALAEIKADPALRCIPVIVLTTSQAEQDVIDSYDLGAAGFIVKPVTLDALVAALNAIARYWLEIVELPVRG